MISKLIRGEQAWSRCHPRPVIPAQRPNDDPGAFLSSNPELEPRGALGPRSAPDSEPRASSQPLQDLDFGATLQLQAQASLPGLAASRSPSLQLPPSARRKAATSQSLRDCFKTPSQGGPPPGSLQELTRPARQRPHSSYRAHSSRARSGSRAPSLHSLRAAFSPGTLRRNWAFDVSPVSAHFTFRSSVLRALGPQGHTPRAPATPHPFLRPRKPGASRIPLDSAAPRRFLPGSASGPRPRPAGPCPCPCPARPASGLSELQAPAAWPYT